MKMFLTTQSNTPYTEAPLEGIPAGTAAATVTTVVTDASTTYQTLLGFGGAFTEAAAVTFAKMGGANQKKILSAYFDKEEGLGYSLGRIAIGSSDFSVDMYDYLEGGAGTFDISREERAVFPMVQDATETRGEQLQILASPWSPPAYMKDNKNRKQGGRLLPEHYDEYAQYLIKFINEAHKHRVPVDWMSIQNEPEATQTWDSCRYTPEEERDFVKRHLGPALEKAGLDRLKLLIHDHNRGIMLKRALPILQDAEAARFVWGTALHWYVSEEFEESTKLHEAFPDKHLLFTEGCVEGGPAPGKWGNGERYAHNIIGDLNNWVEGWLDWNLVLDMQGGPNHVGNFCCAPILCDTEADKLTINPSYYYIGHFAKYIKPGAVRISGNIEDPASSGPALEILTARNPDGGEALVALNTAGTPQPLSVTLGGNTAGTVLPPHSIATIVG